MKLPESTPTTRSAGSTSSRPIVNVLGEMVVDNIHHHFDGHPVRDFIPVFVEREVVARLRATSHSKVGVSA